MLEESEDGCPGESLCFQEGESAEMEWIPSRVPRADTLTADGSKEKNCVVDFSICLHCVCILALLLKWFS